MIKKCKWYLVNVDYKDERNRTVAMIAAHTGNIKDLPKKFYHDPLIKDSDGDWTVAMIAAFSGCI